MLVFEFVQENKEGDYQRQKVGNQIDVVVAHEGSGVKLKHIALAIGQGNQHCLEMQASTVLERTQRKKGMRELLLLKGHENEDDLDYDYLVEPSQLFPEHSDQSNHQARDSEHLGPGVDEFGLLQILACLQLSQSTI